MIGKAKRLDEFFSETELNPYCLGKEIEHHAFGKGTVVNYESRTNRLTAFFEKLGQTRTLSADYFDRAHTLPTTYIPKPDIEDSPLGEEAFEQIESPSESDNYISDSKVIDYLDFEVFSPENTEELLEESSAISPQISDELRKKLADTPNLWKCDDVPHSGWSCVGISDLGEPAGICEMCGYQIIRYVHHMVHPAYRSLDVGCICAGKMEGDVEKAKKRENDFKRKESRRNNFVKRKWKISKNGNQYLKIKDHVVVLFRHKNGRDWMYSIDSNSARPRSLRAKMRSLRRLRH